MSFLKLRIPKSIRVFHACMTTAITFFNVCYIEGYSSPIEDSILKTGIMKINTYTLFASSINIGAAIGSLIAGPICEWLGLKTSLILFSQLGTLGCMLLVLAHDDISMIVGRFVIGFYTAICLTCVPVYNAEISSESMNKFYGGVLGLAVRFGLLLCYFLGIWFGYRWLAVVYMIMVVFMNLNLVFLPESPKWLRNKGWNKKADEASEYYYNFPQECSPLVTNDTLNEDISSYFAWPIIRPLLVCISVQVFKGLSGYEYLLIYSAHTLDNAVSINPRVAAFFYPISLTIGSTLFLWIIHKVHWKKLLIVTTFLKILTNGLLSLTLYLSIQEYNCTTNTQNVILCYILQIVPIPLIGVSGVSFGIGWGSISWWLYGQILHPRYKSVSAGIANFVLSVAAISCQLIYPILAENLGEHIVFLIFAVFSIIGLTVQLFY